MYATYSLVASYLAGLCQNVDEGEGGLFIENIVRFELNLEVIDIDQFDHNREKMEKQGKNTKELSG